MEKLSYETNRAGSTFPGQWGGNISSSTWKTSLAPSDSTWYDYTYDLLGRLTQAKLGHSVLENGTINRMQAGAVFHPYSLHFKF